MSEPKIILYDLPCSIRGFVKKTADNYVIVLNSRLNREQNLKTIEHELEHIELNHFGTDVDINEMELEMHEEISIHKDVHT